MDRRRVLILVSGTAAIVICAALALDGLHAAPPKPSIASPVNALVPRPADADSLYSRNPQAAEKLYKKYIAKYQKVKDPAIQDQVGTARLKVGYLAAKQRDWPEARLAFLEADARTSGTGATGDFGTVNDQGAYEAIVAIQAAGNLNEARKCYKEFIERRPLSPLCMACYRRLVRLNAGKPTAELDALIQSATTKQDANAKFESSVCGPKTIEHLCEVGIISAGTQQHDYRSLAKLCHTTDSGTTIEGMLDCLKALHVPASAFKVDREDLEKVQTPAIVLWGEHYVTLLGVENRSIRVFDTLTRSERSVPIPDRDDPDFYLNVILLRGTL